MLNALIELIINKELTRKLDTKCQKEEFITNSIFNNNIIING